MRRALIFLIMALVVCAQQPRRTIGTESTVFLTCRHNDTMEAEHNWKTNNNPCWNWNPHHTYDQMREFGKVNYITEMTVEYETGLLYKCESIVRIEASNDSQTWRTLKELPSLAKTGVKRTHIANVGAYRYIRITDPKCFVDYSALNLTFNATADIEIKTNDVYLYVLRDGKVLPYNGSVWEGDRVIINITVRNTGESDIPSFLLRMRDDDRLELPGVQEIVVKNLTVNSSKNVTFYWKAIPEKKKLWFYADALEEIDEKNESNNICSKEIKVETETPILLYLCVGTTFLLFLILGLLLLALLYFHFTRNSYGKKLCPRCGMRVREGVGTCPVCGRRLYL